MSTVAAVAPATKVRSVEMAIAWFAAAVLLVGAVLWVDRSPSIEMTDFSVTYIGARMVHEGRGSRLYDLAEQQKTKASLFTNAQPLIFEHPPFEALLLSPLGGLSYRTAYLIWGLVNAAVWLYLPYLLRAYTPSPQNGLAYLALWILFPPLGIALYQGQSSLLLLLVFSLTFISLTRGRDFRAGLWLGLGLFKFQFVVPLAIIFLLRRRWNVLTGFLVSASALALLSIAAVGWYGVIDYIRLLLNVAGHPHNFSYGQATDMATLQAFCNVVLKNLLSAPAINLVVVAASAALVVFAAKQWQGADAPQAHFNLFFATTIVVSLATGVHMFAHDLSPLALALFLLFPYLKTCESRAFRAVNWSCIAFLWIPPLYFIAIARHQLYLFFPILLVLAVTQAKSIRLPSLRGSASIPTLCR